MKRIIVILALFFVCLNINAAQELPKPQGRLVNDFAGILPDSVKQLLETELRAYEALSSIEIAVVTVSSLDGNTVDDYGTSLFEAWGIGKKGLDNGILILLAPEEKKWVIRTGYGMEGYLTDALSSRIGREAVRSNKGNYPAIVQAMVIGIKNELGDASWEQRKEYDKQKALAEQKANEEFAEAFVTVLIVFLICAIIAAPFVIWIMRTLRARRLEEERLELEQQIQEAKKAAPGKFRQVENLIEKAEKFVEKKGVGRDAKSCLRNAKRGLETARKEKEKDDNVIQWLIILSLLGEASRSANNAIEEARVDLEPPQPPHSSSGNRRSSDDDGSYSRRSSNNESNNNPSNDNFSFGGGNTGGGGASGSL
jgi:uncharacterized protein